MFDILRPINKYLLYPLYYWRQGDERLNRLVEIEPIQYWSTSKIQELQLKRLKTLVNHGYKHTEYYKRILDSHQIHPNDIQILSDIQYLPLLTKKVIQDHLDELVSDHLPENELVQDASGGSTGEPTIYYKDKARNNLRRADQIRHDRWSGWNIGDRSALIWGANRDLNVNGSYREQFISRFIERRWELNAFDMSKKDMEIYTRKLQKIQPRMILGYASALSHYALYLQENQPDHKIRPHGVISAAETLSDEQRNLIEQVFQTKVLNRYGSREVGLIASECKHQNGLHINADNVLVEVVNNGKPVSVGELGDIVVTDLWNYGMPFIRYKMEDVGSLKTQPCSCGRGLPLMGSVKGRTGDFFVSKDGSRIHGEYFTHLFYHQPEISKFQIIQESLTDIQLKIVETPQAVNRDYLVKIEQQTKETLGSQIKLDVHFVNEIPPTASGKSRFTISKI